MHINYTQTSLEDEIMNKNSTSKILDAIAQAIFDKKGFNILALDVRGISTFTDYYLIAEGSVERHVSSISKAIVAALEEINLRPLHVEGDKTGDWAVIDYGEIAVHLLIPELREKYALEELWSKGQIVDLHIVISKENSFLNKEEF